MISTQTAKGFATTIRGNLDLMHDKEFSLVPRFIEARISEERGHFIGVELKGEGEKVTNTLSVIMEFQIGKISVHCLFVCYLVMCTCNVLRTHCFTVGDAEREVIDNEINRVLSLLLNSPDSRTRISETELLDEGDSLNREKRFPRVPLERCESDADCPRSHCCARKFGVPVCRKRAKPRQVCNLQAYDPLATNELFTTCPCVHDAKCRRMKGKTNKSLCVAIGR